MATEDHVDRDDTLIASVALLVGQIIRLAWAHRAVTVTLLVLVVVHATVGPTVTGGLVVGTVVMLLVWRLVRPLSFGRWVTDPVRSTRRRNRYRREWRRLTLGHGLASEHTERDRAGGARPLSVRVR